MDSSTRFIPLAALAMLLLAVPAGAQQKTAAADLKSRAKISEAAATKAALDSVPGGNVTLVELTDDGGKVLYSIDVKLEGQDGVERVRVDATTGKVVSRTHEKDAEGNC